MSYISKLIKNLQDGTLLVFVYAISVYMLGWVCFPLFIEDYNANILFYNGLNVTFASADVTIGGISRLLQLLPIVGVYFVSTGKNKESNITWASISAVLFLIDLVIGVYVHTGLRYDIMTAFGFVQELIAFTLGTEVLIGVLAAFVKESTVPVLLIFAEYVRVFFSSLIEVSMTLFKDGKPSKSSSKDRNPFFEPSKSSSKDRNPLFEPKNEDIRNVPVSQLTPEQRKELFARLQRGE